MCFNSDIPLEIGQTYNGITVNETWCGNVLVADDITLLSSQSSGLQSMLISMESYSKRWRFEFNPEKSVEVTFGESTKLIIYLRTSESGGSMTLQLKCSNRANMLE